MAYYKVRLRCVIGIRRKTTSKKSARASGPVRPFAPSAMLRLGDRPQDIEDDEVMGFFGGKDGDADESQG